MTKSEGVINYDHAFITETVDKWNSIPSESKNLRAFSRAQCVNESTLRSWIKKSKNKGKQKEELEYILQKRNICEWIAKQEKQNLTDNQIIAYIQTTYPNFLRDKSYDLKQKTIKRLKDKSHALQNGFISREHNVYRCSLKDTSSPISSKCSCKRWCGQRCENRNQCRECTDLICSAFQCRNRDMQQGKGSKLVIKSFGNKGSGLVAEENIKIGSFVIEYTGEIISEEEKKRREERHRGTYIFDACNYFIDRSKIGNRARFINHSCRPNCYAHLIDVNGNMRIGSFAQKTIKKGQEISIYYGDDYKIKECLCEFCVVRKSK
jgi:hypothetical protein